MKTATAANSGAVKGSNMSMTPPNLAEGKAVGKVEHNVAPTADNTRR